MMDSLPSQLGRRRRRIMICAAKLGAAEGRDKISCRRRCHTHLRICNKFSLAYQSLRANGRVAQCVWRAPPAQVAAAAVAAEDPLRLAGEETPNDPAAANRLAGRRRRRRRTRESN